MTNCPFCGQHLVSEDSRICTNCGKEIPRSLNGPKMNSITVSPPLDQRDLKKLFASVVGEIQGEYQYKINDFTMSILTGNTFTLRSFDYIGLVLVSMIHGSTQKVVYGVAGRGGGLLGSTL